MRAIFQLFENWIDPYRRSGDLQPPRETLGFILFYLRQAKAPFFAMLVVGGLVAMVEAGLFWSVGLLVDMLDSAPKEAGWDGLLAMHGGALAAMALFVLVGRMTVVALNALLEEQTIVPGFFNMMRWQAYVHVARQSLSFFQNDFSGRIVSKVWAGGQATGDLMVSLLQVVWFILIYALSTMALVAALDWRLAAVIAVWLVGFGFIARHFNQHSRLGAYMDPMADKLLLVSVFVVLGIAGELPLWLVVLAVSRDALIVFAVLLSSVMGQPVEMKPLVVSKLNTAVQLVLAALVLAELAFGVGMGMVRPALIILSGLLTVASAAAYLVAWLRHMSGYGEGGTSST